MGVSAGVGESHDMPPEQAKREIACQDESPGDGQERLVCDHLVTAEGGLVPEIGAVFARHGMHVRGDAVREAVTCILAGSTD
jgi:hypothetical protein